MVPDIRYNNCYCRVNIMASVMFDSRFNKIYTICNDCNSGKFVSLVVMRAAGQQRL